METFTKLFGSLLVFVYHCFDRIVINGYLSGLSRPEQVVHFVRNVLGIPVVSKEVLSGRTNDYQHWVEAFARNHRIPLEWAGKGVRKEDYVLPALHRMERKSAYGVYFIFKSMEQGRTFRISVPKYPTQDPNYRIPAHQTSRFTHYCFYIRDEVPGPIIARVASFFPFHATCWLNGRSFMEQELNRKQIGFRKNDNAFLAADDVAALQAAADRLSPQIIRKQLDYWTLILGPKFSKKERSQMSLSRFYSITQIEYCRNFIFKRHFPVHKIFERSCEIGLWRLTANRISEIFGVRLDKRLHGKLATVIDQIEHGHHVFRAYWKHAFLKQYEKFSRFLRNELCSNNLRDFGLKKGLDHLDAVRKRFQIVTDRFAGFQAQCLNVHVDFPLLQKIALPITVGSVRYPGIKIHDTRIIRLLEILLHNGTTVGGWTANQIHEAVLSAFRIPPKSYGLNQLRYDLRKLKGHRLLQRDGRRYAYRVTAKGTDVALLFLFFHKRLCGPLANSRFHHKPDSASRPNSKLEAAYHKADKAIDNIVTQQWNQTGKPARIFTEFEYRTGKTKKSGWDCARRVVAKAEHIDGKENPRFVVTSLTSGDWEARTLYEELYCARGDMENRIKEQFSLFADRVSAETMRANQLRLYLSATAYILMSGLRRLGLKATELAQAQVSTIRTKLLRTGAQIRVTVRKVWVSMASSYPWQDLYRQVWTNLRC